MASKERLRFGLGVEIMLHYPRVSHSKFHVILQYLFPFL